MLRSSLLGLTAPLRHSRQLFLDVLRRPDHYHGLCEGYRVYRSNVPILGSNPFRLTLPEPDVGTEKRLGAATRGFPPA
jgi:hypothetical protein